MPHRLQSLRQLFFRLLHTLVVEILLHFTLALQFGLLHLSLKLLLPLLPLSDLLLLFATPDPLRLIALSLLTLRPFNHAYVSLLKLSSFNQCLH